VIGLFWQGRVPEVELLCWWQAPQAWGRVAWVKGDDVQRGSGVGADGSVGGAAIVFGSHDLAWGGCAGSVGDADGGWVREAYQEQRAPVRVMVPPEKLEEVTVILPSRPTLPVTGKLAAEAREVALDPTAWEVMTPPVAVGVARGWSASGTWEPGTVRLTGRLGRMEGWR
jgi:hypothetical protein